MGLSLSRTFSAALFTVLATGCSTLGPKADVSLVSSEISANKTVGNIVVAGSSGIPDPAGINDKAIAVTAMASYGERARPVEPIRLAMGAIGMDALGDLITAPYQTAFAKVIEDYVKAGAKTQPTAMPLPSTAGSAIKLPTDWTDLGQLKALVADSSFKDLQTQLTALQKASSTPGGLPKALNDSAAAKAFLASADKTLFSSLDADHILLTYIDGDEKSYDAGTELHLYVALVNLQSGNFRYFASVKGKKGLAPYSVQVALMASSALNSALDGDPLPEIKVASK